MAPRNPTPCLAQIPKFAIAKFLVGSQVDGNAVSVAYASLFGESTDLSEGRLLGLRRGDLVKLVSLVDGISTNDLRKLVEDWRYRGMKSLYLHRLCGKPVVRADDVLGQLTTAIIQPDSHEDGVTDIAFDFNEAFMHADSEIIEFGYSYTAFVNVVDPLDETPKQVGDLRRGFVWLCADQKLAAICARDASLRDILVDAIQEVLGLQVSSVQFTKDLIASLEPKTGARRMALVDPSTRVSRRYSGRQLGADATAQREIKKRLSKDDAPNSGYDVALGDGTTMVMGYNNGQGKIFFSRDLSVTQLRAWGCKKIAEIVEEVRSRVETDDKLAARIASRALSHLPKMARPSAMELMLGTAACIRDNKSESPIRSSPFSLAESLGSRVTLLPYVLNHEGEYVDLVCKSCESEALCVIVKTRKLHCRKCSLDRYRNQVRSIDGSPVTFGRIDENVLLLPTQELLDVVFSGVSEILGRTLSSNDYNCCIIGRRVLLRRESTDVVLPFRSLVELDQLLKPRVPASRKSEITSALGEYKEKCKEMSNENCSSCVAERKGPKCYLRLFGMVDSTFTPRPHQGNEFGDYHRSVTVDGTPNQSFALVMKSAVKGKSFVATQITSSTAAGREILEQVLRYFRNPAMHVVGVSIPNDMHPELRAMLADLARFHEKKLVVMNAEELAILVYTAQKNHKCTLDEM